MSVRPIIEQTVLKAIERAGFRPIPSSDKYPPNPPSFTAWSFTNGQVRLNAFHSLQTGELEIVFEHPPSEPVSVPLARLFVQLADCDAEWTTRGLLLYDPDRAQPALRRLSEAVKRNSSALARITPADVTALYEDWAS